MEPRSIMMPFRTVQYEVRLKFVLHPGRCPHGRPRSRSLPANARPTLAGGAGTAAGSALLAPAHRAAPSDLHLRPPLYASLHAHFQRALPFGGNRSTGLHHPIRALHRNRLRDLPPTSRLVREPRHEGLPRDQRRFWTLRLSGWASLRLCMALADHQQL